MQKGTHWVRYEANRRTTLSVNTVTETTVVNTVFFFFVFLAVIITKDCVHMKITTQCTSGTKTEVQGIYTSNAERRNV